MSKQGWVDELGVMKKIAERLEKGYEDYGPLVLSEYDKDPIEEALEEVFDGMVYCAIKLELIKRERMERHHAKRRPLLEEPWYRHITGRMDD
jgi:hypothetical protein